MSTPPPVVWVVVDRFGHAIVLNEDEEGARSFAASDEEDGRYVSAMTVHRYTLAPEAPKRSKKGSL